MTVASAMTCRTTAGIQGVWYEPAQGEHCTVAYRLQALVRFIPSVQSQEECEGRTLYLLFVPLAWTVASISWAIKYVSLARQS